MRQRPSRFLALLLGLGLVAQCAAQDPVPATRDGAPTVRFLTEDINAIDYWPCFSPDGKNVLFSRSLDNGKIWSLYVIATAGGTPHRLEGDGMPISATRANWSAEKNLIAFTGESNDRQASVWLVNADGTNAHPLHVDGLSGQVFYPSWYPDGTSLAVMDAHDQMLKRVDLQHGSATALTSTMQVLTGMPAVSPDGKQIAFAGQRNIGRPYDQSKNQIWLLEDHGQLHALEESPAQGRAPSWSPDGAWLAFESNRGGTDTLYAAFIVKRDGTGLRRVSDYELGANHPVWSPDGQSLVVAARFLKGSARTGIAIVHLTAVDKSGTGK